MSRHFLAFAAVIAVFAAFSAPRTAFAALCGGNAQNKRCDLATYGGPGGGNFRAECPQGYYLTGMGMTAGSYVDSVTAQCKPWDGKGFHSTQHYGGPGGGNAGVACDKGKIWALRVIVALEDNNFTFVRGIRASCTGEKRPQCGGYQVDKCKSVPGDKYDYNECPDGMVGVGLKGKHGKFVDSLGLICGPKPTAEAAPAPAKSEPPPPLPAKNFTGNWAVEMFRGGAFTFILTQQGQAITGQMVSSDPQQNGTLQGALQPAMK